MSYNFLLASAPGFIALFGLSTFLGDSQKATATVLDMASHLLPSNGYEVVEELIANVTSDSNPWLVVSCALGAFWIASNGAVIAIKGLKRIFATKSLAQPGELSFIRKRLIAFLLVVVVLGTIVSGFLILGLSYRTVNHSHLLPFLHDFQDVFSIIPAWLVAVTPIWLTTTLTYRYIPDYPNGTIPWKASMTGAFCFIICWVTATSGFVFYANNIGQYNRIFDALGSVFIIMTWCYLTSLSFLVGAQVTALQDQ